MGLITVEREFVLPNEIFPHFRRVLPVIKFSGNETQGDRHPGGVFPSIKSRFIRRCFAGFSLPSVDKDS
jgi:hypothetical protein